MAKSAAAAMQWVVAIKEAIRVEEERERAEVRIAVQQYSGTSRRGREHNKNDLSAKNTFRGPKYSLAYTANTTSQERTTSL